ncbi:MAG TPA: flavin reductase [Clostridium sp.]|nr:flavin reductase [Clostridium sp.]
MSDFKEIKVNEIKNNPFEMIGTDWMLITAKKNNKVNTMTASWGGLGVIWNRNVVTIYIKPQHYTKEFIDESDTFSITVFSDDYRKELSYLGTVSGRNQDKIKNIGLTVMEDNNTPYFNEGKIVFLCKKLYAQEMNKESFMAEDLVNKNYLKEDFHTMYIGEIIKVLEKED